VSEAVSLRLKRKSSNDGHRGSVVTNHHSRASRAKLEEGKAAIRSRTSVPNANGKTEANNDTTFIGTQSQKNLPGRAQPSPIPRRG
jgi:hypothetical protein